MPHHGTPVVLSVGIAVCRTRLSWEVFALGTPIDATDIGETMSGKSLYQEACT